MVNLPKGCGLMTKPGIGWFTLELVTYPVDTIFKQVKLDKETKQTLELDKTEGLKVILERTTEVKAYEV